MCIISISERISRFCKRAFMQMTLRSQLEMCTTSQSERISRFYKRTLMQTTFTYSIPHAFGFITRDVRVAGG